MFIAANFIRALSQITGMALDLYMWVLIIRSLVSWVNPDPYNPIVQFLTKVTEPVLQPIRKLIPAYKIGVDLSPLVAILGLVFLKLFLVSSLYQLAERIG